MRRLVLAVLAVVLIAAAASTQIGTWTQPAPTRAATYASTSAQSMAVPITQIGSATPAGITVTGEGTVTVTPDIAKVTLGVEVTNSSASGAQQDAASKMDSVMSELKSQGIQDKDIQTIRADLQPDYDYSTHTPVLKGYRATNLVVVTVRDLSKMGGLLDSVVSSGATQVQGISFSVSDPTAAGAQGRDQAMKDAKTKADQLAKAAGVVLGPPIAIQETVSPQTTPVPMAMAAAPSVAAAPRTPISPGTRDIRTVVQVTYSIK